MLLPAPNPQVIYKAVDNGAVLLSLTDEVYYGLNGVGSYIWEHLAPALQTFDELCIALSERYPDAVPSTIRVDVQALLHDLMRHGLVRAQTESARLG